MGLPDPPAARAGTEGVFWFLVFRLDLDKVSVDLDTFVNALAAEGLPFYAHYTQPFTEHDWFKNRAVFGTSGYPWTCPLYQGDPDQDYPLPNRKQADATLFQIKIHENMTEQEAEDIFKALRKVEDAFLNMTP